MTTEQKTKYIIVATTITDLAMFPENDDMWSVQKSKKDVHVATVMNLHHAKLWKTKETMVNW